MTNTTDKIEAKINVVLASAATSYGLKSALTDALRRGCVDAVSDADLLAEILGERCIAILGRT